MLDNPYIQINNRKFFLTEQGKEYYQIQLANGLSYKKLAEEIQITPDTLSKLCRKNNIAKDNRRKFTLNSFYFSKIDTKEKAYWLGFLAADGSINESRGRIDLELQTSDREHIQKFLTAIGSNKEIKERKVNHQQYNLAYCHLNSTQMVKDLIKLGLHQNKSLDLLFPTDEQVPQNLKIYWILGYFDGDGCFCSWQEKNLIRFYTSFTGTENVLFGINKFFNFDNKLTQEHNCQNGTKRVQYTEGKSKLWLNQAYDKDSIQFCLQRKYNKYQDTLLARGEK